MPTGSRTSPPPPRRVSRVGDAVEAKVDDLLKRTSRSFHLTLRALPKNIRGQIGMLYLLARLADTIADSKVGDPQQLLDSIEQYNAFCQGRSDALPDLSELAAIQDDPSEAELLREVSFVAGALDRYSEADKRSILTCLDIIVSGQVLDIQRFAFNEPGVITTLANDDEVDDYTYRVAGCVGEFWTRMTLAHRFQVTPEREAELFETGVRFGKALQLINIVRDLPEDLRIGRCYIPEGRLGEVGLATSDLLEPANMDRFRPLHHEYIARAEDHLDAAVAYIEMLPHREYRVRLATILPVIIGQRTLALVRAGNALDIDGRIKVQRKEIKRLLRQTIFALPFKGASKRLLRR